MRQDDPGHRALCDALGIHDPDFGAFLQTVPDKSDQVTVVFGLWVVTRCKPSSMTKPEASRSGVHACDHTVIAGCWWTCWRKPLCNAAPLAGKVLWKRHWLWPDETTSGKNPKGRCKAWLKKSTTAGKA